MECACHAHTSFIYHTTYHSGLHELLSFMYSGVHVNVPNENLIKNIHSCITYNQVPVFLVVDYMTCM